MVKKISLKASLLIACLMLHTPMSVIAEVGFEGTYVKTFTISAYYSPLPCQNYYVTGSFEGDKRLNGNGVSGADGTPVYPGMIAAPKTYQFGTKMHVPGVGTVAVHDRGGAIVASNGEPGRYDRLDIWMGYGDKGLKRALNWGKRNVDVIVYGINNGVKEEVNLGDYDPSEATPDCSQAPTLDPVAPDAVKEKIVEPEPEIKSDFFEQNLQKGASGEDIRKLQTQLSALNYYKGSVNGVFDDVTRHAVFKFQQSQGLVADINSSGAGVVGPKTRDRLNELIAHRDFTQNLIAQKTAEYNQVMIASNQIDGFTQELDFGMQNEEIKKLQAFLRDKGYFTEGYSTGYFGAATKEAVLRFQLAKGIISSESDTGAGRVGPSTLSALNSLI